LAVCARRVIGVGMASMSLTAYLSATKKRPNASGTTRSRLLAGIKKSNDTEIIAETLRASEAINRELDRSRHI